jgi:hypothetical protein
MVMKISRIQKTILGSYTVIWLLAIALLLGMTHQVLRRQLFERQVGKARIVAANVALAVADPLLIGELDRLKHLVQGLKESDADVVGAWLVDKNGKCLAATDEAKVNQNIGTPPPPAATVTAQRDATGQLQVATGVLQGSETIGALYLTYSPAVLHQMLNATLSIIAAVSAGCMVGGLILYAWIINRSIVRRITQAASRLDANSHATAQVGVQVATSAGDISTGTRQQSAALEETCAALEQMTSMIKRSTANTQSARELGNQTKAAVEGGSTDVQTMNHAMADIKSASDNIAKIIKTIDEISFQTNLLALNAAVEAARAGEAGAGFAVVADEVRSLAQRCAQSARETAVQIEDSIQKSERGVAISNKVAESLQDILGKARQMDSLLNEIAQSTTEQNQAISGINTSVSQIEQAMQSAASSTTGFVNLASELQQQAEGFKSGMVALKEIIGSNPEAPSPTARNATPTDCADQALGFAPPQKSVAPKQSSAKASRPTSPTPAPFADFSQ